MANTLERESGGEPEVPRRRSQYSSGRLLAGDAILGSLMGNEARGRLAQRLWGVPKDKSALVTGIALAAFTGALLKHLRAALRLPTPTVGRAAVGAAVVRESVYTVAGPKARQEHFFGTMIALAMLGGIARPLVRSSMRAARALMADLRGIVGHRYRPPVRAGAASSRRAPARRS
jgi:hypothetical protein